MPSSPTDCKDSGIFRTTSAKASDTPDGAPQPGKAPARRPERPLIRVADGAILGGVCAGIARRLGVHVRLVRILAVLSIIPAAIGVLAYVTCWSIVPREGEERSAASAVLADRRQLQIVLAVATVALAVFITFSALGGQGPGIFSWPLLLSSVGALCVWRGVSDEERANLQERFDHAPFVSAATSTGWRTIVLRACLGGGLVAIGAGLLSKIDQLRGAAIGVFVGTILVCAGFFVLFAPWWLRTLRDLSDERRQRVRAQERADVAAHLHDSVLQTLLLIQKASNRPAEVVRLARNQERELRHWLFDPASGGKRSQGATLATLAEEIERDVEEAYGVGVELIVVGDCAADEAIRGLVAAGREAAVNAAKWSGAATVSMYAEVEATSISLFVRDIGAGFDPGSVGPDRKGISCSIVERMVRFGGHATIRSAVGAGTEVELVLPREHVEP
jgi:signal transduction histidine kinase